MGKKYAEVSIDLPTLSIHQTFYYLIPENLKEKIKIGSYVIVPFGERKLKGFVVGFEEKIELENAKEIIEVIEEHLFSEKILTLAKWTSLYYFSPLTEVLHCILPPPLKKKSYPTKEEEITRKEIKKSEFNLNKEQLFLIENIKKEVENNAHKIFLIQGEKNYRISIYLKLIEYITNQKKSVIILVPEISLVKNWKEILNENFDNVGILHSELSKRERNKEWEKIKNGKTEIVIGTRLAVFAPVYSTGLIIVEEEQDNSYKQISTPRYNARDVAIKRAKEENAVLILGTSTPSLESYYLLEKILFTFKREKFLNIKIIDMKKEKEEGNRGIFSRILIEEMKKFFMEGDKIFLFLNRRGYSRSVVCSECGEVMKCPNCLIPLSYHITQFFFLCHYCNFKLDKISTCPKCKGIFLKYKGIGIQKIEEEIKKIINSAKILRIDSDTILKKNLDKINFKDANIILGTSMSIKDIYLKDISLIGIINADISLHFLDFRAGEKTYQLLSSLINKTGDKTDVVIQTFYPKHYVMEAIKHNDYLKFYQKEIEARYELNYPPFSHLINITCSNEKEEKCKILAEKLKKIFSIFENIEILGPTHSPIFYLKKKFRYQIFLKIKDKEKIISILKEIPKNLKQSELKNLIVDVDPLEIS